MKNLPPLPIKKTCFVGDEKRLTGIWNSKNVEKKKNTIKRADYYKKKARVAALKAFNAAMYFSDIKDGLYDKAKGFFEYELDKEHGKIK